jgi:hypothetical protein
VLSPKYLTHGLMADMSTRPSKLLVVLSTRGPGLAISGSKRLLS